MLPTDLLKVNEGAGTRTQDLRLKRPLLYLLSYASAFRGLNAPPEKVIKSTTKIKNIKKKQKNQSEPSFF